MSRTGSQLTIMQPGWPPRWPTSRGTSPARAAEAGYAMEMAGLEPASPRCKRGALPVELHPRAMRTDGVEPPQHEAPRLQRGSSPLLSVRKRKGDRPDSNRYFEVHNLGCSPLHHSHHETSGD